MKKERVLFLGGNFFPEPTGIGKYSGEMIEWLADHGHDCTVVTTFPYYPHWKIQEPYVRRSWWYKNEILLSPGGKPIRIIRCPHYIPDNPSGIFRIISEFSFIFSAYLVMLLLIFSKKFQYVITVAPPFALGLLGIFYKKVRGGKFLYHVQDLQIDAARDLNIIKGNSLIKFFLSIEKFILNNSDCVSTISEGMLEKLKKKCKIKPLLFPNWVDTTLYYPLLNKGQLKSDFGFKATDIVILYSGAIGHKQGLEELLLIAKRAAFLPNLKFAICGSGPYKDKLIQIMEELKLDNVVFLPLQPFDKFNAFLNMADMHLVLQKKGAGDLVLPSKLSTILSVGGVAIVTANEGTSLYRIVKYANSGILIEPGNEDALYNAVTGLDINEIWEKSINARTYAENHLSKSKILHEYFAKTFCIHTSLNSSGSEIVMIPT